jgi:hypothetical protein
VFIVLITQQVCPVLRDVGVLFSILTNFLNGDSDVKKAAAEIGLADLIHKLWVWCCALSSLLEDALKMLSTFTTSCLSGNSTLAVVFGHISITISSFDFMPCSYKEAASQNLSSLKKKASEKCRESNI